MAKYTMELRRVIDYYTREEVEKWFKSYEITDYLTPKQIEVVNKCGLWNKEKLAKKIVNHYFMREIGFETPALFKLNAENTMNEIMEEYLPLIYSSSIEYDPLINVDFTETFTRNEQGTQTQDLNNTTNQDIQNTSTGNSSSNSSNNSSDLSINSKTPQGQIVKENILNGKYASDTTANESESNIQDNTENSSNSNSNAEITSKGDNTINSSNDENYVKKVKGNSGVSATAQKMIEQYRQNIIAIDKKIIEDLNILFMGLY